MKRGLYCLIRLFSSASASFSLSTKNVFDIAGFADQAAGFRVGEAIFVEVAAHPVAQLFGLSDIQNGAVCIFIQIHSGIEWESRSFFTEVHRTYTLIVARFMQSPVTVRKCTLALAFFLTLLCSSALKAQEKSKEAEPPEEDETLLKQKAKKEYSFNPIQANKEIGVGNYYMRKGAYKSAMMRFQEATNWNPSLPEAWLRLAEANDKLKDVKAARAAYAKYLEVAPDAKNADSIRKRLAGKK